MRFDIEWQDAPGVRDRVLAATWARLTISVGGLIVTELLDQSASSRRTAVYGSVFPLAEWIVENWWNLIHEPSPVTPLPSGRSSSTWLRPLVQRHNLLAARDGGALPDLGLWRDGDEMVLQWAPDVAEMSANRVRFLGQGRVHLAVTDVEGALRDLVAQVLGRLDTLGLHDEDSERLRQVWAAIRDSSAEEPEICRRLAILGLNPYDPDEATEAVLGAIERVGSLLPVALADDLMEGSRPPSLLADLAWIEASVPALGLPTGLTHPGLAVTPTGMNAHELGYAAARHVRRARLKLSESAPVHDLADALVAHLDWSPEVESNQRSAAPSRLDALVGRSATTHQPLCIVPSGRGPSAARFRLARAAYFIVSDATDSGPRLLSAAATKAQRASRAFAAELLVPAAALATRVAGATSEAVVEEIAEEFQVNPLVVRHQIENHRLGFVEA